MMRQVCPRCKRDYRGYPALSRVDNKTEVCSNCGIIEADIDCFGLNTSSPEEQERHKEFVRKLKLISGKNVLKGRYWLLKKS